MMFEKGEPLQNVVTRRSGSDEDIKEDRESTLWNSLGSADLVGLDHEL
jgi:hypothetical protein